MTFDPVTPTPGQHRGRMENTHAHRIVVGVDGSRSSVAALRYAADMAVALKEPLHVVTTWTAPPIEPYLAIEWSPAEYAREILDESIAEAFGDEPPGDLTSEVLLGPAARTLIRLSDSASMLVLGSRGHGGFVGLLLGSVSAACAEHAHCPVLIVHTKTASDGEAGPPPGDEDLNP